LAYTGEEKERGGIARFAAAKQRRGRGKGMPVK